MSNLNYIIMKNLKLLFVAFALFALQASAAIPNPKEPKAQIRAEIIEILGKECPFEFNQKECLAEMIFTINSKSEIIIITVNSTNKNAEFFLKSKLNYKKVTHIPTKEGELFLLPLRIAQDS